MFDLQKLNGPQREAVTHGEGPLLLLAGPGSGKTYTILNRIFFLLSQGIPPEKILVLTFTRKAAESLKRRFYRMSFASLPVWFGTFHAAFFQMLQQTAPYACSQMLPLSQRREWMVAVLQGMEREAGAEGLRESLLEDAGSLLDAVGFYKNTLREKEAAQRAPARWRADFGQIRAAYQALVEADGRPDFDDILLRCRQLLLTDETFRSTWQQRFSHILVDEFQDVNPVQYEALKLLAGRPLNLFAVGDDDQSIYGFRGSEPACMMRFERECHARRLLLNVNYRSRPEIVNASLMVIGENRARFEKALRPYSKERGEVRLTAYEDSGAQLQGIVKRLKEFSKAGDQKTCAVLFRTNRGMQRLAAGLFQEGIDFEMGERTMCLYEQFIAKDITAYLRLAAGEWERELLFRVINRPNRFVRREALWNAASPQKLLENCKQDPPACRAVTRFVRQLDSIGKLSPGLAVSYVLKGAGYGRYLEQLAGEDRERAKSWAEQAAWLKEDAGGYESLSKWLEAQEAYARALDRKQRPEADGRTGREAVRLMTVHGAKGLEFDHVLLPDCNEGVFPHGTLLSEQEIEEERRIFYVAMTRAKESLEMSFLSGKEGHSRPPSRFLAPLSGTDPKKDFKRRTG